MKINERLRKARIRAGFRSAADAAKHLKVPYGTYSGHESGSRGVKASEIALYASEFGVSVGWLTFGESGGPSIRETSVIGEISTETSPYVSGYEAKDRLVVPLPAECNDNSYAVVVRENSVPSLPPECVVYFDKDAALDAAIHAETLCILESQGRYRIDILKMSKRGKLTGESEPDGDRIQSARPISAILPLATVVRVLERQHVHLAKMAESLSSAVRRHRGIGSIPIEELD